MQITIAINPHDPKDIDDAQRLLTLCFGAAAVGQTSARDMPTTPKTDATPSGPETSPAMSASSPASSQPPLSPPPSPTSPATSSVSLPALPSLPPLSSPPAPSPSPPPGPLADVDSAGVPWSADVHAGNKAKLASGLWRKRRGGSKEAYDAHASLYKTRTPVPGVTTASSPPLPPLTTPAQDESIAALFGDVPTPGAATIETITAAIAARSHVPADEMHAKLVAQGVDPVGLEQRPGDWQAAFDAIEATWPIQ